MKRYLLSRPCLQARGFLFSHEFRHIALPSVGQNNQDIFFGVGIVFSSQQFKRYGLDPNYINNRVKLGIHAKRIAGEGSIWHTKNKPRDLQELSETTVVPRKIFWPGIEINIYANKVVFMNFAENNSVLIESKAIADAMRQAYHLSWLGAKGVEITG